MKFSLAVLCLAFGVATASSLDVFQQGEASIAQPKGPVIWVRCGGVATMSEVRIDNCEGQRCTVIPGSVVGIEADMIPAVASPSLTLIVDAIMPGEYRVPIMTRVLENSSVQPGQPYMIRFTIVPNDVLSGQAVLIETNVRHTDTELREICAQVQIVVA